MAPGILLDQWCDNEHHGVTTSSDKKAALYFSRFPATLTGPLVWKGSDFPSEATYTLELTPEDVKEVQTALHQFKLLELDGDEICPENFVLPTLRPRLLESSKQVHSGIGFANIRGLNPGDYSAEDNALLFLGISSYIGDKRGKQDEDGNMLAHISNSTASNVPEENRPVRYSNRASTFHTDTFCDILAMQTRSCANIGGKHSIASSWTIYSDLAATRPETIRTLATSQWHFDSRSKLIGSNQRPLLFYVDERLIMNFAQEPLRGVKDVDRAHGMPKLSPQQDTALEAVETIAGRNQLTLNMLPGDLTFINNHAILHTREAFIDTAESTRYIVRMWLKNTEMAWNLPAELQHGNDRIYEPNEVEEVWNVLPVARVQFKLSERLCS